MYTYIEIKDSLSTPTASLLSDADIYSVYKAGAESIILTEKGDIEKSTTPVQAFVWILEYMVINKITNLSEDKQTYYYNNYNNALGLLRKNKGSGNTTSLGAIADMYEV